MVPTKELNIFSSSVVYSIFLKRGSDFWSPWQLTHPLKIAFKRKEIKNSNSNKNQNKKNPENGNQSKPSLNHKPQSRVMSWLSQTSGCLKAGGPTTAHWGQSDCGPRRPLTVDKWQLEFLKLDGQQTLNEPTWFTKYMFKFVYMKCWMLWNACKKWFTKSTFLSFSISNLIIKM